MNSEINKLNKNIENLNKNIERLLSLVEHSSGFGIATPIVAEMFSQHSSTVENISALMSRGINLETKGAVNVVKILNNYREFNSTCFEEVHYNSKEKVLTVFFKGNRSKKAYNYTGVEQSVFNSFISANSLGRFYTKNIKGAFFCS